MAAENFKVKKGLEVGTGITANSDGIIVTGIVTATQFRGDGSGLTGVVASGTGVVIKEEGNAVGTAGTINFVGSNILATLSEGTATVTVNNSTLSSLNVTGVSTFNEIDANDKIVGIQTDNVIPFYYDNVSDFPSAATYHGAFAHAHNTGKAYFAHAGWKEIVSKESDGTIGVGTEVFNIGVTSISTLDVTGVSTFRESVNLKKTINDTYSSTTSITPIITIRNDAGVDNTYSGLRLQAHNSNAAAATFDISVLNSSDNYKSTLVFQSRDGESVFSEKLRINQDGNVGIGSTIPIAILDVVGNTELDDLNVSGITTLGSGGSGSVVLKHAGNQKLITTANGIEVPDLNVTGVGTVGRLDTNGVTLGTNSTTFAAKFADNARAIFGGATQGDFGIYHDTLNSYLHRIPGGTGDIYMVLGGDNAIIAKTDSSVELYWDNAKKLETEQSGVKITGVCTATSFSGSAAGLTNIPSAQLTGALPSLDGSALTGITASGSGIIIQHDGSNVGTAGTINFSTNLDVSAISAGIVTVTASGSSGLSNIVEDSSPQLGGQLDSNGNHIKLLNSNKLVLGTNSTYEIYNDSSNLIIDQNNDGLVTYIRGKQNGTIQFDASDTGNQVAAKFKFSNDSTPVSSAELYYGGNKKFETDQAGVKITGVCTATSFSGSGASLTSLDAGNLGVGTIPNGRFPATLPTVSGANLTALNADNISSGTLASARIEDNAVTFAKMQDVSQNVLIGRNSSGSGDMEALSASDVRTLLNVADGATAGITTASSNFQATFELNYVSSGGNQYRLVGPGQDGTENYPNLYLVRGQKYRIIYNSGGGSHPVAIYSDTNSTVYEDGITYSNTSSKYTTSGNNLDINLQHDAPEILYYQCASHSNMRGTIYVIGGKQSAVGIGTIVGILTATGFSGSGANLTNLPAGQLTGTLPAISGANLTNLPAGQLTGTVDDARISTLTASKLSGALPAISGANLTNLPSDTPSDTDIQVTWTVTASGNNYRFTGPGNDGTENNPDLYLVRGQRYRFIHNATSSHPLQIKDGNSVYTDGVTYSSNNNGGQTTQGNNLDINVQYDAPASLTYVCTNHAGSGMVGNIYIVGGKQSAAGIGTIVGILTATGFSGSEFKKTGGTSSQFLKADGSVDTNTYVTSSGSVATAGGLTGTPDITVDDLTVNGNTTLGNATSDTVTINAYPTIINDSGLRIRTTTNAAGAKINFSDQVSGYSQNGTITYKHNDGSVTTTGGNSNDGWIFEGSETRTVVKVVGDIEATSDIYGGTIILGSGSSAESSSITSKSVTFSIPNNLPTVTADETAVSSCNAIEYTIFVTHSSGIQSQKVLIMDNGTTAYSQEYAVMFSSSLLFSFSTDINSGNVRLQATPQAGVTGSTIFKFIKTIIK